MARLAYEFFHRDCRSVAHDLVGKVLVHQVDGQELRLRITETECYRGEEDTACHAHKGRTPRTEVLYGPAGTIYVYLCYGVHWLLNIVTGEEEQPQAVLIRCCESVEGPGKLTKKLGITGSLNRQNVFSSDLWIEDDGFRCGVRLDKRVGIGYAAEEDQNRLWRYILDFNQESTNS